jgi:hypothetical protein
MAQGWYCFENGKERGPVSEQKIREALARGRLNDESYVRFGADGDWVLVRDSKFGSLASNPMAPPKPPAPETRGGTVGIWSRLKAGWTAAVQRPTPPTARSVQGAAIQLAKEKQIEAERAAREAVPFGAIHLLKEDRNGGSTQLPLPQVHGTRAAGVVWPLDGWPQLGFFHPPGFAGWPPATLPPALSGRRRRFVGRTSSKFSP